jgi:hypothetical protein
VGVFLHGYCSCSLQYLERRGVHLARLCIFIIPIPFAAKELYEFGLRVDNLHVVCPVIWRRLLNLMIGSFQLVLPDILVSFGGHVFVGV